MADAHRFYDQLRALGGRPTRPIKQYPNCKTDAVDSRTFYRDEYEKIEVIFEVDRDRSLDHWIEEVNRCSLELLQWKQFKENQRIHNQNGPSRLELDLENTDIALVDVVSKLKDWQEFQLYCQSSVHETERFLEHGHVGDSRTRYAMSTAAELEACHNELIWVKSQWAEVVAEACLSIAAAPKLQEELESKLDRQLKAIYRALQKEGARPSRIICAPHEDAGFSERLQHWVSEISDFSAELWSWRLFKGWREDVRDADNMYQKWRNVLSKTECDSCPALFEDLVTYHQQELDEATSWTDCWRLRARQDEEAKRGKPLSEGIDISCDVSDDIAERYAKQAEERVFYAAKRLERSKHKLQEILADLDPSSTDETPAAHAGIETPPTPPRSPSPEILRTSRKPSKQQGSGRKGRRRSKKERARKGGGRVVNANTEQHALPKFSMGSNYLKENENDIEMSDDADDSCPIMVDKESDQENSEDTVMSDIEKSPSQMPLSPPQSQHGSTSHTNHRKLPSPSSQPLTSRKTGSATKLDQVSSGKVHKKPNTNKPPKKSKNFTEQQTKVLLDAASTDCPSVVPTTVGRSEAESHPTPPTNTNYDSLPSPDSSDPPSRRSQPTPKIDRSPTGKIHKKPNKDKPRKKPKKYTEAQTKTLLDAASPNCSPTGPTPSGKTELESYPNPPTSIDSDTSPSPSPSGSSSRNTHSTSKTNQPPSKNVHKNSNNDKPQGEFGSFTETHEAAALGETSTGLSSTGPDLLEKSESKSHPTPPTSTDSDTSSSASSSNSSLSSSKTPLISIPETNQIPSNKPPKNPNENKPRKEVGSSTEEHEPAALNTTSTGPSYSTPPTDTDSNTLSPASSSTSSPRKPPSLSTPETNQPPSHKPHKTKNKNKNIPRKKVKNYTEEQTKGASDAPSTSPAKIRRLERLRKKAAAGKARE